MLRRAGGGSLQCVVGNFVCKNVLVFDLKVRQDRAVRVRTDEPLSPATSEEAGALHVTGHNAGLAHRYHQQH
jgi:hypothetical protein